MSKSTISLETDEMKKTMLGIALECVAAFL